MTESGRALQVVEVAEDHSYRLDEAALRAVLMRDEIRDMPIVVVSLAGAYRGGKSFMLNFFLRYLTSPVSARQDGSWVGDKDEVLRGFNWRAGSRRNTTGILIWSEPLITTLPNGDKVAVLLMDTQGTFDNTSTVRDCSTIFALSTLISSVQIYNLPGGGGIQEDDLQHLQLFTEYGKLVSDKQEGKKAFQVLEFLVRDWANDFEYAYGNEGGQRYLDQEIMKVSPQTPQELKELRAQLLASFENVTCFLMPYPGQKVRKQEFKGFISEMEPEFVSNLHTLSSSVFGADKLKIKLINGRPTKAGELFIYFKTYMNVFNSDKIPTPTSILKATTEAGLLLAMTAALEQYEAAMEAACGAKAPAVPAAMVKAAHQREMKAARATFTETKKLASHEQADEYLTRLTADIDKRESQFLSINMGKTLRAMADAKELYDKTLQDVSGDNPVCVHAADVSEIHDQGVRAALQLFDAKRMRLPDKDDERDAFIRSFDRKLKSLKLQNEMNNKMAISDICNEYSNSMEAKSMQEPPLSPSEFESEHRAALARALDQFNKRRTRPNHYPLDADKTTLKNRIEEKHKNMKLTNQSHNKAAIYSALRKYVEYITKYKPSAGMCYHPAALGAHHNHGKCVALNYLRPRLFCGDGRMSGADNDGDVKTLSQMIDGEYTEVKGINDVANRSVVDEALSLYKSMMDERCYSKLWFILVVPMVIYYAKLPGHHTDCKQAAFERFDSKRESDSNVVYNHSPDDFRANLDQLIEEAYSTYK